jgi:hypothetical protein
LYHIHEANAINRFQKHYKPILEPMITRIRRLVLIVMATIGLIGNSIAASDPPTNFVVILSDDMGLSDLGC